MTDIRRLIDPKELRELMERAIDDLADGQAIEESIAQFVDDGLVLRLCTRVQEMFQLETIPTTLDEAVDLLTSLYPGPVSELLEDHRVTDCKMRSLEIKVVVIDANSFIGMTRNISKLNIPIQQKREFLENAYGTLLFAAGALTDRPPMPDSDPYSNPVCLLFGQYPEIDTTYENSDGSMFIDRIMQARELLGASSETAQQDYPKWKLDQVEIIHSKAYSVYKKADRYGNSLRFREDATECFEDDKLDCQNSTEALQWFRASSPDIDKRITDFEILAVEAIRNSYEGLEEIKNAAIKGGYPNSETLKRCSLESAGFLSLAKELHLKEESEKKAEAAKNIIPRLGSKSDRHRKPVQGLINFIIDELSEGNDKKITRVPIDLWLRKHARGASGYKLEFPGPKPKVFTFTYIKSAESPAKLVFQQEGKKSSDGISMNSIQRYIKRSHARVKQK